MIIAVDAAGGDYAPHEVVKGAIQAAHEFGIEIVLVGRKNVLRKLAEKSVLEASTGKKTDSQPSSLRLAKNSGIPDFTPYFLAA